MNGLVCHYQEHFKVYLKRKAASYHVVCDRAKWTHNKAHPVDAIEAKKKSLISLKDVVLEKELLCFQWVEGWRLTCFWLK